MRRTLLILALGVGILGSKAAIDPDQSFIERSIEKTLQSDVVLVIESKTTLSNGSRVVYGAQWLNGKAIHGANFTAVFAADKLISIKQSFVSEAGSKTATEHQLGPAQALQLAMGDVAIDPSLLKHKKGNLYTYMDQRLSSEPITVEAKWLISNKQLFAVNEISFLEKDHEHWYCTRHSAVDGQMLDRNDWMLSCDLPEHRHNKMGAPSPIATSTTRLNKTSGATSYEVFAMPVESPNHGSRSVVTDPHDSVASPFGWHDVNGVEGAEYTITRGNNVYASEDKNADNAPGNTVEGGSQLHFTSSFDSSQSAALYTDASIVNLFYWNNLMHDVWYQYGFDEQSGNFQQNNYGNGGAQGDFVNADAQDGSGNNNANFATPPDGISPRMQMFIWNAGSSSGDYFQVNSPSNAAGKYVSNRAAFGATLTTTAVTGDLVEVSPTDGCVSLNNGASLSGKIAFIKRGNCTFVEKARLAQAAGAIAVVIYDSTENNPILLGGTASDVTIPVVMIRKTDGLFIKNLISAGVNVSLYDSANTGGFVFDSDFDAGIIAHEYGHGISIRLTGGANNSNCLSNQEQMGEGWSDFFGLVMTHEPGDQASDVRGVGTYVTNQSTEGNGIRNWPYSTNMNVSPYVYNNIKQLSVPHGVGSVWCSMLWDMYWAFIDKYGYDSDIYHGSGGNNMAMQLVINGLKLQGCNPGFEDGRDAILLADMLNNNGDNQKLIWEVFARRGLGYSASQGSSASRSDGVQAFDIPPIYKDELFVEKRAALEIKNGGWLSYDLVAKNFSGKTIYNITLTDTLPEGLFLSQGEVNCASYDQGVVTIELDSLAHRDSFVCSFSPKVQLQKTTSTLFEDNMESGQGNWEVVNDLNTNKWSRTTVKSNSGTYAWRVLDVGTSSDQSLIHSFDVSGTKPVFSFYHFYNTEADWDGGVVELSLDKNNWVDAKDLFILNGYNGTITVNEASALSGREGFTGNSQKWLNSKIDLSDFNGKTIWVKFRFASDGAQAGEAWYLDDVSLEDAAQITNTLHASYDTLKTKTASAVTFVVDGDNVSVPQLQKHPLYIYPNPAKDVLQLEWEGEQTLGVKIMDIQGKSILQTKVSNKETIDVSGLTSGTYIIEVRGKQATARQRVVIE